MDQDQQHLRILAIAHLALAAVIALVSCFPILHLTVGISMLGDFGTIPPDPDVPRTFGLMFDLFPIIFIVVAGSAILGGWVFAAAVAFCGLSLYRRRRHTYCLVMSGLECMFMPIGTVIGVLTLLLLLKPGGRDLFQATQ